MNSAAMVLVSAVIGLCGVVLGAWLWHRATTHQSPLPSIPGHIRLFRRQQEPVNGRAFIPPKQSA